MFLRQLEVSQLRNLVNQKVSLQSKFNVFFGENGSGKTSILEAVHILGLGRSFRHHQLDTLITHGRDYLRVVGHLEEIDAGLDVSLTHCIGIEKSRQTKAVVRKDGRDIQSLAVLAETMPLQLIHPASDELVQGSPTLRRQFMDWSTFHVEQSFFSCWQRFQRVLKQRNAALKLHQSTLAITAWNEEFSLAAEQLSFFRQQAVAQLQDHFQLILHKLWPQAEIELQYQRGWSRESTLESILSQHLTRDMQRGYTGYGPQRDELLILCQKSRGLAAQILSRGEQKLVVIALRLAQGQLLKTLKGKSCLFLLDDMGAELDREHRLAVGSILQQLESQVLLTTIEQEDIAQAIDLAQASMFHVEHGEIKKV